MLPLSTHALRMRSLKRVRTLRHPRRFAAGYLCIDWTGFLVRAGQVADAEQEFPGNLAASEGKGLLEQLDPVGFAQRMIAGKPCGEGAVRGAQVTDSPGILDSGVYLQTIAHDTGVVE